MDDRHFVSIACGWNVNSDVIFLPVQLNVFVLCFSVDVKIILKVRLKHGKLTYSDVISLNRSEINLI